MPRPTPSLHPRAGRATALAALALLSTAACRSAEEHAAAADREVYEIVEARRAELFGEDAAFTIDPPEDSLRQRILRGEAEAAAPLTLLDCLEIAAENSRTYQTRKESLYLTALDLSFERWDLGWQYGAGAGATLEGTGSKGDEARVTPSASLSRVLGTGAEVMAGIGASMVRVIGSGGDWELSSDAFLRITQPLLRDAGRRIVRENLTQAERDVVYEVRSFERFRRTFAVDVANRFYRLLQQLDRVRNEERNFDNLVTIRERNEALSEAGRLSDIQVDQARQDELRSESRLLEAQQSLQGQLDDFKLFLGLPPAYELALDMEELDKFARQGAEAELAEVDVEEADALRAGLAYRLDHLTALDQVTDRERKVYVAANALEMGLDVTLEVDPASKADKPLKYDFQDMEWSLGLGVVLPVNLLPERNAYRSSLINLQRARRDQQELSDVIKADLRDELRSARRTRLTYEIQRGAVVLAERRVESARLNLDAGRASTRDILEAQEALLEARNARTGALFDFTLARLALYRDMELLRIDEGGIRVEPVPAEAEDDA